MDTGHDLNTSFKLPLSDPSLERMEELFVIADRATTDFSKFIELLMNTELWKRLDYPNNLLKDLCKGLSIHIQNHNQSLNWEPNYHSRSHFKDVCIALSLLIQSQTTINNASAALPALSISPEEAWILLFCAIGHDCGHNGTINTSPFELEKKSISQVHHWLNTTNYPPTEINALMNYVEPIVLATDPKNFQTLLTKKIDQNHRTDLMALLMVEADLMASILPVRGALLSRNLAMEWNQNYPDMAKLVNSIEGRIGFLERVQFTSPHSQVLNISAIQKTHIHQLKSKHVHSD
jgi:hypothetical protein